MARTGKQRVGGRFVQRGGHGRRADLGNQYFRSRSEANLARFLTFMDISWAYEAKTFEFTRIKSGRNRQYRPDFFLPAESANVGHEVYYEVKGWMDPDSRIRLDRMAKYYPEVQIHVISTPFFQRIEQSRLCLVIPGWECSHTER